MPAIFKTAPLASDTEIKKGKYTIQMNENSLAVLEPLPLFFNHEIKLFEISIGREIVRYTGRYLNTEIPINELPEDAIPIRFEKIEVLLQSIVHNLEKESTKVLSSYLLENCTLDGLFMGTPITSPYNSEIEKINRFIKHLRE